MIINKESYFFKTIFICIIASILQFSLTGCVPKKVVIWEVNNISQEEIVQLESFLKNGYKEITDETYFIQTGERTFDLLNDPQIYIAIKLTNKLQYRIAFAEDSTFRNKGNFSQEAQAQLKILVGNLNNLFGGRLIVIKGQ